jgi:hypothetical protein
VNPVGRRAVEFLVRTAHPEDFPVTDLRDHLLSEHGRDGSELDGLPLVAVHRFEHVEADLGLLSLGHRHRARGSVRATPRRARRADL